MATKDLYVSPIGNDAWSGSLAEANAAGDDGPLATIGRARDMVREWKLSGRLAGPVTVWLRGGRHVLRSPLVFTPDDAGPITFAGYDGEQAVIDGGERLRGWRLETVHGRTAWTVHLPDVAAGAWTFRSLFVNGQRRPRARLPKQGFYWMANVPGTSWTSGLFDGSDTFQCAPGDVQPWRNQTDIDVVAYHYWIEERLSIAAFDPATNTVTSARRSMFALKDDVAQRYARYVVENVFEALSEPGEWYLDRPSGVLYYLPMEGESPETAQVYAPRVEQALRLEGQPDAGRYVEYLCFRNLTVAHTDWRQPPGGGERFGRPGIDFAAAPQAAFNVPAAISLSGARYCAIEDCSLQHAGGYGVEIGEGCSAIRIVGNEIADMGAGGVKLGGADATEPAARRTGDNRITDNHIHGGGRVYASAVGVLAIHSFGNTISHNHIHDLFYTGISCGWVWGYAANVSRDNRIEKNHIHDIGHGLLSDMGGIYTLGVQPGTVIRGNLIHDVVKRNYGGWAIYPDEGSSHILIENNVCYNTTSQVFHQHYGRENIVRNNIFAFGQEGQASLSRAEGHNSFTFQRNIVIANGQPAYAAGYAGQLEKRGFKSDLNVLWDVSGQTPGGANAAHDKDANWVALRVFTLEELQALGYDRHSIVADPRCRDAEHGDFTLAGDSPAWELGFEAIDLADVGPRPAEQRD